jgi:hypothetical protein
MNIEGFELVNAEKIDRVINGTLDRDGALKGGLGADADPADILAGYDRLGGLIRRDGDTVKTGTFWDFKAKKAVAKPIIVCQYRINGKVVEVADGEKVPGIVRAFKQGDAGDDEDAEVEKPKRTRAKVGGAKKAAKKAK